MFFPSIMPGFMVLLLSFGQVLAVTMGDLNRLDAAIDSMNIGVGLLGRNWRCGYLTMMSALEMGKNIEMGKAACLAGDRFVKRAITPAVDDLECAVAQMNGSLDDSEEAIEVELDQILEKTEEMLSTFKRLAHSITQHACAYKLTSDSDTAEKITGPISSYKTGFEYLLYDLSQIPSLKDDVVKVKTCIEDEIDVLRGMFDALRDNDAEALCLAAEVAYES